MEVELRPMTEEEFAEWYPRIRDRYAADMVEHAGASHDAARQKGEADMEHLFPGREPADGQDVFAIDVDGQMAGDLWIAEREDPMIGRVVWIYDIHVDDAFRRRGLGRRAMQFAEEEARRRGISRVSLNVFGGNEAARNLYRSLGYEETAVFMRKDV